MADTTVTEADIHTGQVWRDSGTPHLWRVHSVVQDHLTGDLYETTVMLVSEFDGRDTLRIPGSVLLANYTREFDR